MVPSLIELLPLPGLTWRHLRGPEDAAAYVALVEACREMDQLDPLSTLGGIASVEETRAFFTTLPLTQALFVMREEQMVAAVRISWWTEADGTWLYPHVGRVHPAYRGSGIGTAMLRWAEATLRAVAAQHPTHGKGVFGANASSTEVTATALLVEEGYKPFWTGAQMEFTSFERLPELALPSPFPLRSVKSDQHRTVWEAIQRFWRDVPSAAPVPGEEDYQEFAAQVSTDPALCLVAWDHEQPVGVVLCRLANGCGIIDEVSVDPAYRRRGLAQALLVHALTDLQRRGIRRIRLHTDAANPTGARSLYEKLGFSTIKTYERYRKPLEQRG